MANELAGFASLPADTFAEGPQTSFIDDAHAAGLQVHPYTHRNEERYLTLDAEGNFQTPEEEILQYIEIGFDGFFTDFPGTGVAVVDSVTGEFVQSPQNPDLGDRFLNGANAPASQRDFEAVASVSLMGETTGHIPKGHQVNSAGNPRRQPLPKP